MIRRSLPLVGLLVVVSLAGCSAGYQMSREARQPSSPWPFYHGDASATGAAPANEFQGKLEIIWNEGLSGKPSGPLTIHHGFIAVPSSKGRIQLYRASTGKSTGKIKAKGPVQTGLVLADSLACFAVAPNSNRLSCVDLLRGKELWRRSVKDASRGSIIIEDRLLVGSGNGRLGAFNVFDGSVEWSFSAEDERFTAPAASGHGLVFQPGASGVLYALSPDDGSELYRVNVKGPMVGGVAVAELVIGSDMLGNVYGIEPTDGALVWTTDISGPIWTTPAIAEGRAFVGHSGGELVALDMTDGRILWRFKATEVITASAAVIGRFVVVGTLGGNLYVLNAADGAIVSHRKLAGRIDFAPITDGDHIYVATDRGKVFCLGDRDERATAKVDQRKHSEYQPERTGPRHRPGSGHGLSESRDLRPPASDGAEGR